MFVPTGLIYIPALSPYESVGAAFVWIVVGERLLWGRRTSKSGEMTVKFAVKRAVKCAVKCPVKCAVKFQ